MRYNFDDATAIIRYNDIGKLMVILNQLEAFEQEKWSLRKENAELKERLAAYECLDQEDIR